MIAPSPDWFVAVSNVALVENGKFIEELTVESEAFDSGTDSGVDFNSDNINTDPAEGISKIKLAPLGNSTQVSPSLAEFSFKKLKN
jgi:hypothetical protein